MNGGKKGGWSGKSEKGRLGGGFRRGEGIQCTRGRRASKRQWDMLKMDDMRLEQKSASVIEEFAK